MKPKYYKCINKNANPNTKIIEIGIIYKHSEYLSEFNMCYRLLHKGEEIGDWTQTQFELVTEEEYLIQEGLILKQEQNYDYLVEFLTRKNIK